MATEYPPLSKIHVVGYSANDKDYPIINQLLDPRVAGYKVPEDFSACPDKRYPNHIFTGAQPISGDQRVRHAWEILPSPWVPFTRYDDDLGPIQGRRRFVKNDGQVASLAADKKVTYEAREGSAIVYTELEETWSIATDDDGNSLFPIKDRDFYDASRGPVQERRQLFVPTGEEQGSLENINGVITQTSYEPYNEFLSVKIVQTYKVDGPQLVGKVTDNDGQLVTVTTQRKGALDYVPPSPAATRTVEVSREDAESLVERIVDTPEVFKANTFSVERPDPIPQKFRVAVPIQSSQEIVEGTAVTPTLEEGEISKSEEQRNKFIKRISSTSRDQTQLPVSLTQRSVDGDKQNVTVTETVQDSDTIEENSATVEIRSEALGDGNYLVTKSEIPEVFDNKILSSSKPDVIPEKFRASIPNKTVVEVKEGSSVSDPILGENDLEKTVQRQSVHTVRETTVSRDPLYAPDELSGIEYEESFDVGIPFVERIANSLENNITADISPIGNGKYLVREYDKDEIEGSLESFNESYPTRINLALPPVLKSISLTWDTDENSGEQEQDTQAFGAFTSISIGDNGSCGASISITPQFNLDFEDINGTNIFATTHLFFVKGPVTVEKIMDKCGAEFTWPVFKTKSYNITTKGVSLQSRLNGSISYSINANPYGIIKTTSKEWNKTRAINNIILNIKPCIHGAIEVKDIDGLKNKTATAQATLELEIPSLAPSAVVYNTDSDLPSPSEATGQLAYVINTGRYFYSDGSSWIQTVAPSGPSLSLGQEGEYTVTETVDVDINLTPTTPNNIPRDGIYLVDSNVEPYKYGFYLIRAVTIDASIFAEEEV